VADVAIDTDVASRIQKGTEPAWVRHHAAGFAMSSTGRPSTGVSTYPSSNTEHEWT